MVPRNLLPVILRSIGKSHTLAGLSSKASGHQSQHVSATSYLLFLPSILAGGLGAWQIQRSGWKEDLIDFRRKRLSAEAVHLSGSSHPPPGYSCVSVTGEYANKNSVYIGPRVRNINGLPEKGYLLVTPLKSSSWEKTVLVNRGWVPEEWRKSGTCGEGPSSEITVKGVMATSETPSRFIPDNKPESNEWFWVDTQQIAVTCGLPEDTPIIQIVSSEKDPLKNSSGTQKTDTNSGKYPAPKELDDLLTFSVMPSGHLSYSAIWFALSGSTAFMALKAIRKGR